MDEEPGFEQKIPATIDTLRDFARVSESEISQFFSRPVKIYEHDWDVGGIAERNFNPWALWLRNKRVVNRINNYRNFSGTLCVKVLLNGNQFYWGAALLPYNPATPNQRMRSYYPGLIDRIPASQRIHLWLEPTTNEGGCMRLPFLYNRDAIPLPSATDSTLNTLGRLQFDPVVQLRHDTSTKAIRVTYYAWVDDIILSSPTAAATTGLVPQSGDEYSKKPISSVATSISGIASKLTKVPGIAPYAMATQQMANAVGGVARAFGYSKPTCLQEPKRVRAQMLNSMAVGDGQDECDVLALTSKQEVSIDPRLVGLSEQDEMDIEYLCGIESWIGSTTWLPADAPDQVLCSIPVSPWYCRIGLGGGR